MKSETQGNAGKSQLLGKEEMTMAENPYLDGRLNIGQAAQVKAVHNKPSGEKAKKITGNDLRNGKK